MKLYQKKKWAKSRFKKVEESLKRKQDTIQKGVLYYQSVEDQEK